MMSPREYYAKEVEKAVKKYQEDLDFFENGGLDAQEPTREMYAKHGLNISDAQLERYHSRWRAQKANKPQDPRPQWERFFEEAEAFQNRMNGSKPKRKDFSSDEAFYKAQHEWDMSYHCDAPNAPGYYRAAND